MEIKKNPKANLENYSKILVLLGLVFALFVAYQGIEWKTFYAVDNLAHHETDDEDDEEIPITQTQIEEIKPPPPPPPPPAAEIIEVVKDDKKVEETLMDAVDTDEDEEVETEVIEVEDIEEEEEEEDVDEEVPFAIIENVPVYPGCTGSNDELKKCMSKKITKHVNKKFDLDLAQELNLEPGRKRIRVGFKIDKNGNITNIRAAAPHPRLEKEAIRIIKSLPRMKPGKQRNKPVIVTYNLPITFNIEEE